MERDLADALENKTIAGAGLDVLTVEPMSAENPLKRIKDSDRLIITLILRGQALRRAPD